MFGNKQEPLGPGSIPGLLEINKKGDFSFPLFKKMFANTAPLSSVLPISPGFSGGGSTSTSTRGDTIIHINGGDLNEVRRVVREETGEQFKQAIQDSSSPRKR